MAFSDRAADERAPRPVWPIVLILVLCLLGCAGSVAAIAWGVVRVVDLANEDTPDPPASKAGTTQTSTTPKR